MLGQRRGRWPSNKPALDQRVMYLQCDYGRHDIVHCQQTCPRGGVHHTKCLFRVLDIILWSLNILTISRQWLPFVCGRYVCGRDGQVWSHIFHIMCISGWWGDHHSISRGGGGRSIFERNNYGQTLHEINIIFQELFYIYMYPVKKFEKLIIFPCNWRNENGSLCFTEQCYLYCSRPHSFFLIIQ